jgi:hypothetical protein
MDKNSVLGIRRIPSNTPLPLMLISIEQLVTGNVGILFGNIFSNVLTDFKIHCGGQRYYDFLNIFYINI